MNKYCWMAKQMRNFNDSNSIIQWSNAMICVKNLLLHRQETYSHHSPTTIKRSHGNPRQVYSVSKPTTLSFQPLSKPYCILTPSSTPSLNFAPHEHSPLSLDHAYRLSIQPTLTQTTSNHLLSREGKLCSHLKLRSFLLLLTRPQHQTLLLSL